MDHGRTHWWILVDPIGGSLNILVKNHCESGSGSWYIQVLDPGESQWGL